MSSEQKAGLQTNLGVSKEIVPDAMGVSEPSKLKEHPYLKGGEQGGGKGAGEGSSEATATEVRGKPGECGEREAKKQRCIAGGEAGQ